MARSWEYPFLTPQDYFAISKFESPNGVGAVSSYVEKAASGMELQINRIEVTRVLAKRILDFIQRDQLSTRELTPDAVMLSEMKFSKTVYTVNFALHLISGKRGGWFVLDRSGREPVIKDEFIEFGPMRKSGGRKNRYRRKLSYSEQNQVDFLKTRTPTLDQMSAWILQKYPSDVRNLDYYEVGKC